MPLTMKLVLARINKFALFQGIRNNGQAAKQYCIHMYRSQRQQRAMKINVLIFL